MQRQRPVQEAGAGAAGAELLIGFDARLNDLGVCGESKIVVRTEHDAALALHDDLDVLLRFERMEIWINAKALASAARDGFAHFSNRSIIVSLLSLFQRSAPEPGIDALRRVQLLRGEAARERIPASRSGLLIVV